MKNRLKELLASKGMKLYKLAEELEISRNTLYQIANCRSVPSVEKAIIIARYFNVTVEELFILE